MPNRKSPLDSATKFRVGTKKIGNNGAMWQVILTSNNIKIWAPYKSTRKCPIENATKFKIGTIKKGNNGEDWKIAQSSNRTKRWVQLKKLDKSILKMDNTDITYFDKPYTNKIKNYDAYYIYESDLTNEDTSMIEPIGILVGNGYGDGSFSIFKGSGAYFIMSANVENKINNLFM